MQVAWGQHPTALVWSSLFTTILYQQKFELQWTVQGTGETHILVKENVFSEIKFIVNGNWQSINIFLNNLKFHNQPI